MPNKNYTGVRKNASKRPKQRRERSTIEFPYNDEQQAVDVVKEIVQQNPGDDWIPYATVAQWLGFDNASNGTLRIRLTVASIFRFIEIDRDRKHVRVTPLGRGVCDQERHDEAVALGFLRIPLYRMIYDKYAGQSLPNDEVLEAEMASLGVIASQAQRARQVFHRSAETAGFFKHGQGVLVLPDGVSLEPWHPEIPKPEIRQIGPPVLPIRENITTPASTLSTPVMHPLITELLRILPESGMEWSDDMRRDWLTALEHIFKVVYKNPRQ